MGAGLGLGASFVVPPTFTAKTTFLSPQQQSSASAALAQIGALASLAGAGGGLKSPADQFVSLMQSDTVSNRVIDQFKLMGVYDKNLKADARKELLENVKITAGKKDNLITIEVDDHDPKRAADMANAFVDELKRLSSNLALSEAQQRRVFFEHQMEQARDHLAAAQTSLQKAGFNVETMRTEPKATAEAYARTRAEVAATEVKIQTLRQSMTESAPELRRQEAALAALKTQLTNFEQPSSTSSGPNYVGAYREFKYQEALFDIMARQFELAKLDEAREGPLFQVVDAATPPERKSKPRRLHVLAIGAMMALAASILFFGIAQYARPHRRAAP